MGNAIVDALFNENEESVSESHNVNDLQCELKLQE